ncbi:MAG: 4Fe-4S dicluster domain-containing protein [Clostridia bacterium]
MKRVYVNEEWCLGCHLCEYYCTFANSNMTNMAELRNMIIRPNIRVEENNKISFAVSCRHCTDPLCVKSCLTNALSKKDGVISIDKDKCIGCFTCIVSCPYGAISVSANDIAQKCELCTNNSNTSPLCVQKCPNGAIVYEER